MSRIKGIGEAGIRVNDLEKMQLFYEDVLGLEVILREDDYVFFKVAEGYAGHTENLALFVSSERTFLRDKAPYVDFPKSTLHHLAFNIDLADYELEKTRLEGLGLEVEAVDHTWLKVRSLYFPDPEGNLVELVAYDASL